MTRTLPPMASEIHPIPDLAVGMKDAAVMPAPADVGFETFYRSERDRLAAALGAALGDVSLGAEAIDEGMVRAYQRWTRVRSYDNPSGWVYRVAHNWATSRLRRRKFHADGPIPETAGVMSPLYTELIAGLHALPLPQREVVVLKYLLGWSQDDIATALNIRPGTVKSRLGRALAQLRISLHDEQDAR